MTTKTSYAQGTPCWVDLQTSDQDGARAFYSGVFGWEFLEQPMPDGPVYAMAQLGGRGFHPVRRTPMSCPASSCTRL